MNQLQRRLNDLISDVMDGIEHEEDLSNRGNLIVVKNLLDQASDKLQAASFNTEAKAVKFLEAEGYKLDLVLGRKTWISPSSALPTEKQNDAVIYLMANHDYRGTYTAKQIEGDGLA